MAAALKQLRDDAGVQLFTAYVDTTGGEDVNAFTRATAVTRSLGGNDAPILWRSRTASTRCGSARRWTGPRMTRSTRS